MINPQDDSLQADSFRPIEFWKASIMTLPDNAFFELVRTVFGKVKTPFNKQILASDLEKFLLRGDIQKNIANYIDRQDACIIAAIALFNEPYQSDLEAFFYGELNYAELNDLLVNMEERFILYRFQETEKTQAFQRPNAQRLDVQRLALNPLFKPILLPFIAVGSTLLFPSVHADEVPVAEDHADTDQADKDDAAPLLYDDRVPAILLSFVSMNEDFFKAKGGGIRQKVLNSAKTFFPNLPLETLIGSLRTLGMFYAKNERLLPDYKRFSAFGRLSRQERVEYYTASILCHWEFTSAKETSPSRESAASREGTDSDDFPGSTISPWLLRSKIRLYASFIHRLCKLLDPQKLYPLTSLLKLAYTLERDNNEISRSKLIETMKETGLLVSVSNKYWRKHSFADPIQAAPLSKQDTPSKDEQPRERPVIAMDTSFSLMVYPEIEYNDLVKIAAFSHVTEAGLNVRFELNRDSAVSAFNLGLSADSIIELLQRLSQNRIDENLVYTLQDWEKSHREVTLHQGLILTLSPERQYLAETKPLSMYITKTIAPGIYMLPETLEDRVIRALQKAGVSIIARHGEQADENKFPEMGGSMEGFSSNFYPSLRSVSFSNKLLPQGTPQHEGGSAEKADDAYAENEAGALVLIESFHSMLKKMKIDKEKHDELTARIDRRLILCESQLKDAVLRYEKLEARGLDYAGKILIAKQAINLQSLVEVTWPSKQGQERVLGIPKALEKTGNENILVIKPINEEDAAIQKISLGKISLLRRIKRSIFENTIV